MRECAFPEGLFCSMKNFFRQKDDCYVYVDKRMEPEYKIFIDNNLGRLYNIEKREGHLSKEKR